MHPSVFGISTGLSLQRMSEAICQRRKKPTHEGARCVAPRYIHKQSGGTFSVILCLGPYLRRKRWQLSMNKISLEISMSSQGAREALRLHWYGGTAATTVSTGYQSEPVVLEDPLARLEICTASSTSVRWGASAEWFARWVRDSTSYF